MVMTLSAMDLAGYSLFTPLKALLSVFPQVYHATCKNCPDEETYSDDILVVVQPFGQALGRRIRYAVEPLSVAALGRIALGVVGAAQPIVLAADAGPAVVAIAIGVANACLTIRFGILYGHLLFLDGKW